MPRERNPNRDKAFEIWQEHNGAITNRRIAELLGENEKVIAVWKQRDNWNVVQQSDSKVVQQTRSSKRGAPLGSKNALGNRGGKGGPQKNSNAVTHGFFQKYFPQETVEIMEQIETRSPLDILWDNIVIQYTAIIRAQQIMYVRDKSDKTKERVEKKSGNVIGESWEIQHAWDKQATFLQAQSRAMATLQSMIAKYEDLCRLDLADEERLLQIEKLKVEINKVNGGDSNTTKNWTDALVEVAERRKARVSSDE